MYVDPSKFVKSIMTTVSSRVSSFKQADLIPIAKKIGRIAFAIFLLKIAFMLNPYFTLGALAMGFMFPEATKSMLDRIWKKMEDEVYYAIPIIFFCTILHLPMTLALSLYIGARIASNIMVSDNLGGAHQMPAVSVNG